MPAQPDDAGTAIMGSASLRWLIEHVWHPEPSSPVAVTTGAEIPRGYRLAEEFLVVPDLQRARFLVPLASRRAAWASLARYNQLRSGRTRAVRTLLGTTMLMPGGQHLWPSRLRVAISRDLEPNVVPDHLLSEHLRRHLGVPGLAAGLGVHPLDPNRKPTLQLFDLHGGPVGYAKLGYNDATRHLVRTEARALREVHGRIAPVHSPELLFAGQWRGRELAVAAPLPARVRAYPADAPPEPAAIRAIAGDLTSSSLAGSSYWRCTTRRIDAFVATDSAVNASLIRTVADRLLARGDQVLPFGRWHGDCVPWNLASVGRTLYAWDWEHSGADVPLGFDLVHWFFQVNFVLRKQPAGAAASVARRLAMPSLLGVGLERPQAEYVIDLYLLEMFLRTADLARCGGGWNAGLYPHLLQALHDYLEA